MKYFPSLIFNYLSNRSSRRHLNVLGQFLLLLFGMVAVYSAMFHYLMAWEGREYSWITGVYWTLTVMSTLGFGDITFRTDLGLVFSIVVLLSGTIFMLVLLPFTFIQFFYTPWMEAQEAARAPRQLPAATTGHIVLTQLGPVDAALIKKLSQYQYPYAVLVPEVSQALKLHDMGFNAVVGDLDDPETYRRLQIDQAALVASTQSDVVNTNVAFTVREVSAEVPIVATAANVASVDILELAGCTRVLQLAEMMGKALSRRVIGQDAKTHVIGQFDGLLIAEAGVSGTPLVGRSLKDIGLRDHVNISVAGVWERGRFEAAAADTMITPNTVLVLAGTRAQLDEYDAVFCIYRSSEQPVIILGGGRVGTATAGGLQNQGVDFRVVEKSAERVTGDERWILGDAADLETLKKAGIMESPSVVITTHDDDVNVYLTLYCRRLRDDIQIISRSTLERNIDTLHRAGADFVISEASMGANAIFNLLHRSGVLLLAEGLDVFKVPVPASLAGKTLVDSSLRIETGCSVIAIDSNNATQINPHPGTTLRPDAKIVLIGSVESERRFLNRFVNRT
ncbi:MAG: NAD-binding protein [Planctomycetota bacterium]